MTTWQDFLRTRGASFDGDVVSGFGEASAELAAARDTAVLCDLGPLAVLAVTGTDAATFLQGQLTSDVTAMADGATQLSAWCSAKGRVVADFLVRRASSERFELLLPSSLLPPIEKRLRMYVLRAKVSIADASRGTVRLGIGGPAAAACIAASIGVTPALQHSLVIDGGILITMRGNRFLLLSRPERAPGLWSTLAERARPAGYACWEWLTVRAGVPVVTAATQEAFVPQMLNLDALDAISFGKGCYTGQEIVARTQYLGRLKERLALAHVAGACPEPGGRLYASAFGDQPCGTIVNAAAAPEGGADLLAVAQSAAIAGEALRLDDGRALALLRLPYALPAGNERPGRIA
ncbi:MAG TPA: folate-binding protein [Casimicrobiaceae bacterium]|nr:folate-binding protein [Casimicrobiaceae bacterium]